MREWLTDKEKRILFSALSREKKICKEVDKECYREAYEIPLESVCKSLENKFYYDKLFKTIEKETRREFAERIKEMFDFCEKNAMGIIDVDIAKGLVDKALVEMEQGE